MPLITLTPGGGGGGGAAALPVTIFSDTNHYANAAGSAATFGGLRFAADTITLPSVSPGAGGIIIVLQFAGGLQANATPKYVRANFGFDWNPDIIQVLDPISYTDCAYWFVEIWLARYAPPNSDYLHVDLMLEYRKPDGTPHSSCHRQFFSSAKPAGYPPNGNGMIGFVDTSSAPTAGAIYQDKAVMLRFGT